MKINTTFYFSLNKRNHLGNKYLDSYVLNPIADPFGTLSSKFLFDFKISQHTYLKVNVFK